MLWEFLEADASLGGHGEENQARPSGINGISSFQGHVVFRRVNRMEKHCRQK